MQLRKKVGLVVKSDDSPQVPIPLKNPGVQVYALYTEEPPARSKATLQVGIK